MQLEATGNPIKYRLQSGIEIVLRPGVPTELPDRSAQELLLKASGKVREVVSPSASLAERVSGLKPVYWESMEGTIIGPGQVLSITQDGSEFWICVGYERFLYWIRDSLLRSQEAFKAQKQWICSCCQGTDYWTSPYRTHICRMCHPPANPASTQEGSR
jgi:hypothetical protein